MEDICFFPDEWLLDICKQFNVHTACTMRLISRRWRELLKDHNAMEQFRINKICIQPQHGACIRNGDLYMWGHNIFHRLLDHQSGYCKKMDVNNEKIHKILLSTNFTLVLTENKHLFRWGYMRGLGSASIPTLLLDKTIIDVYLHEGCVSAISEDGKFYHWDNNTVKVIEIAIPEERIVKVFNMLNIFGFTTQNGLAYIANRGYKVSLPSARDFMCIKWKDIKIKTVLCWYQGRYAIILTTEGTLYKVGIGIEGDMVSTPEIIRDRISKAIYRTDIIRAHISKAIYRTDIKQNNIKQINSLYYLTREGCIYRKTVIPVPTKETMLSFGKVFVDFSVTPFENGGVHRIDMIDAKGEIEQSILDLD